MTDLIYIAAGVVAIPTLLVFGGVSASLIVLAGKVFEKLWRLLS